MSNMGTIPAPIPADPTSSSAFGLPDGTIADLLRAYWSLSGDRSEVWGVLIRSPGRDGRTVGASVKYLRMPDAGSKLGYPPPFGTDPSSGELTVEAGELARYSARATTSDGPEWVSARFEVLPADVRLEMGNPYACRVAAGSLRGIPDPHITLGASDMSSVVEGRKRDHDHSRRLAAAVADLGSGVLDAGERLAAIEKKIAAAEQTYDIVRSHYEDLVQFRCRRLVELGILASEDLGSLNNIAGPTPLRRETTSLFDGDLPALADFVHGRIRRRGMMYTHAQISNFTALVLTHDLIVLAGDSGTGKTSLVREYAAAVGGRCRIVPVRPNWTSSEDMIGYHNPVDGTYHATEFTDALLEAAAEPDVLHFVCLDEMNIARVEYYFADFLSRLEKRDGPPTIRFWTSDRGDRWEGDKEFLDALDVHLRTRDGVDDDTTLSQILLSADSPARREDGYVDIEAALSLQDRLRRRMAGSLRIPEVLAFPPNVRIVGAVNVDETTHNLSPKILDRVHVMRFPNPLLRDWDEPPIRNPDAPDHLTVPASVFGARTPYPAYDRKDPSTARMEDLVRRFLDPLGLEFGMRAVRQVLHYAACARLCGIDDAAAFNNAVMQKILPKISALDTKRESERGLDGVAMLKKLRDELAADLVDLDGEAASEICLDVLDRIVRTARSNNGIADFWLRR